MISFLYNILKVANSPPYFMEKRIGLNILLFQEFNFLIEVFKTKGKADLKKGIP
tara:strand:- start:29 stop:190 length:162 start_codon:yes stop_codon:yes gene_type:complete